MTRVLRSAVKKNQIKENLINNLSISKKSKTIKRISKKKVITKSEESLQNDIWSINCMMSNIFKYIEKSDLINFNTVCKKWNNVTNPIIHKTIMLQRKMTIQNKVHDKRFVKSAKTDAEVEMCISNNSKHAQYIKELTVYENLKPQRAIQLFETFKFITTLSIGGNMNQDQFIRMINPLTQLQELNLNYLSIKGLKKNNYVTEPAILPPSLTKLTIDRVRLYKNPELFIKTINSHKNLLEFKFISYNYKSNSEDIFLEPFFKNYSSLKIFEYTNQHLDYSQSLIKAFKSISQLRTLKLSFSRYSEALMSNLSRHLTNLEEFNFNEINASRGQTSIISKFTHPTKIKKLNLNCSKLSQCSINSILLNCPYLEELYLSYSHIYQNTVSDISINTSKLANIKKLFLRYGNLDKNSYSSILMKCARVKELNIELPIEWKECVKVIGSACSDLESLIIYPPSSIWYQENNTFYQEFYESEFLGSNSLCKYTLMNLTLISFNIYESKAEYFKYFSKLKCIEYLNQRDPNVSTSDNEINFDKNLWPNYKVEIKDSGYSWDAKLLKLSSQTQ